jgi:hypothetical protein
VILQSKTRVIVMTHFAHVHPHITCVCFNQLQPAYTLNERTCDRHHARAPDKIYPSEPCRACASPIHLYLFNLPRYTLDGDKIEGSGVTGGGSKAMLPEMNDTNRLPIMFAKGATATQSTIETVRQNLHTLHDLNDELRQHLEQITALNTSLASSKAKLDELESLRAQAKGYDDTPFLQAATCFFLAEFFNLSFCDMFTRTCAFSNSRDTK